MARNKNSVTATITAQNSFTDPLRIEGKFNLSLSGSWSATAVLQRRFNEGSWLNVKEYTANAEEMGEEAEGNVEYRIGVETGNWTSGSLTTRLSH